MSHSEALDFFRLVASCNQTNLNAFQICEIGSFDVNGSIRSIFAGAKTYVGVDVVPGPGVDEVCKGHMFLAPDSSFDLVLSSECLEHDPYWVLTIENMARIVRPGGIVVISCASDGRVEHGTSRTRPRDSPGSLLLGDYYRNINPAELLSRVEELEVFCSSVLVHNRYSSDIYFAGIRAGSKNESDHLSLPPTSEVRAIARNTPLLTHLRRLPNYALRLLPLNESLYQSISIRVGKILDND